jgi:pimeloyl-ACP methyl ester carboxylesterase
MMVAGVSLTHQPGEGMPLMLLHGVGSDALSWATALPPGRAAYAWNAPGYGESEPLPNDNPTPADYAARLLAVLDALGLERVALVGHSLGALFAGAFAAQHPERVAALAFFSPALGYGVAPGALLPAGVRARIDDLTSLGPAAFAEKRASRLLFRPEGAALAGVRRGMAAVNPAGYAQAVRALGAGDLLADAARITLPALVAIGAEDIVTPPDNARRLHAALPSPGALTLLPACGHAMAQEAPAATAALLKALADG